MDDVVYFERDGKLRALASSSYETEPVLQGLIADHPDLIARTRTTDTDNARVALITREMKIPDGEQPSAWFSVDHLFVDEDARPVIVETKRSQDTRTRREVVAQMLDYAANGIRYWDPAQLRALVADRLSEAADPMDESAWLEAELGHLDPDPEQFWADVATNLREGRVRLLFVADQLPPSLVRIIEFLNEKMQDIEVLGLELPQFVDDTGHRVLVPRVVGRTSRAVSNRSVGTDWDETTFATYLDQHKQPGEKSALRFLLDHARSSGAEARYGSGQFPAVSIWYPLEGQLAPMVQIVLGQPDHRPYVMFYAEKLAPRIGVERLEEALGVLESHPAWAPKVAETRAADYQKWTTLHVEYFSGDGAATLTAAIDRLRDRA